MDDRRHLIRRRVRHAVEHKEAPLGVGQEVFDATHTEAAFDDAAKAVQVRNDSGYLLRLGDPGTSRQLMPRPCSLSLIQLAK